MTVRGLSGEKSCIQAIGMLLIDLTSLAPTAISATISLDVRPFSAARDLVTPGQADVWNRVHMRVRRVDQDATSPIDTLQCFRHLRPMCSENDDIAFGCLLLRGCNGARAESGDKISQGLRTSGIGYNHGVTSVYQVTSEGTCYVSRSYKSYFQNSPPRSVGLAII